MGISVFFSMIKAIKILNGIKYLEIMKVTFQIQQDNSASRESLVTSYSNLSFEMIERERISELAMI